MYKLKKNVGFNNFSAQFIKIISHCKKIGYNINVFQQTAGLVVNPIMVGNFAFLFNCTLVGRTSESMNVQTYRLFIFTSIILLNVTFCSTTLFPGKYLASIASEMLIYNCLFGIVIYLK